MNPNNRKYFDNELLRVKVKMKTN